MGHSGIEFGICFAIDAGVVAGVNEFCDDGLFFIENRI